MPNDVTRRHHIRARLLRRLGAEDGVALIMAISIVMVLSISTAAAIELVRSNQVASGRERQVARALGVAEAGLDKGMYAVAAGDPNAALATGSTIGSSYTFDGGSGQWSAVKNADKSWTVSALAYSPNGTVQRRLQVVAQPNQQTTNPVPPEYAYGFFMGDPTADCTVLSSTGDSVANSAVLKVPIYIASSLCLSNGAGVAEPGTNVGTIPLYVGGTLRIENTSSVGSQAQPIKSATVVKGCQVKKGGTWKDVICSSQGVIAAGGSQVWAQSYDSTANTLSKTPMGSSEADGAYQTAAPGPLNPCSPGSTVGPLRFDSSGSTTRNTSLGTVRLLYLSGGAGTANNFDCKFYDGSGALVGRLAWTYGTPGTLIVQGKIFIDGNLRLANGDEAVYQGSGTLYVNGTVSFENGSRICGAPMIAASCSGNWDPSANSLMIVAVNAANANPGWNMANDSQFEGIAYTNGRYFSVNGASVQGPVIADSGQLANAAAFKKIDGLPPGAPRDPPITTTTWGIQPGSWRECPPAAPCPALTP
jgi:hypothetical protein